MGKKGAKQYQATQRYRELEKSGERYFTPCLTCCLDCERITGKKSSSFRLETCPKYH